MATIQWLNWPQVRSVNNPAWGTVLNDIDSHLKAGHIYADPDKVTHGHETTHGINSEIRNKAVRSYGHSSMFVKSAPMHGKRLYRGGGVNGFYCLENRAIVIREPNTSVSAVAREIPKSLRANVYDLYMVKQAKSWDDTPCYVFDEWMGYTNGSAVGIDLAERGLWKNGERSETVAQMLEFVIYALTLGMVVSKSSQSYEDQNFSDFLLWNTDRALGLYKKAQAFPDFHNDGQKAYLDKFQAAPDAAELREFAKDFLGGGGGTLEDWGTLEYL